MKKSLKIQDQVLPLPLEQDVACPCSTETEKQKLNNCTVEEMLKVGLVLLDCICKETLSQDLLFLAFSAARDRLERTELDKDKLDYILIKFAQLADRERKTNPLHTMF